MAELIEMAFGVWIWTGQGGGWWRRNFPACRRPAFRLCTTGLRFVVHTRTSISCRWRTHVTRCITVNVLQTNEVDAQCETCDLTKLTTLGTINVFELQQVICQKSPILTYAEAVQCHTELPEWKIPLPRRLSSKFFDHLFLFYSAMPR